MSSDDAPAGPPEHGVTLSAPPGFRLPELQEAVVGGRAVVSDPQEISTVYVDTEDLRLIRCGVTLRFRSDRGWIISLPVGEGERGTGAPTTDEVELPGTAGHAPGRAADLVRAYSRVKPLVRVARLRTLRRRVALRGADDRDLIEVVDDEVSVFDGRRIALRFREITVGAEAPGSDDVLAAVTDRLRRSGAGPPDPTPVVVRALGPRALDPPDVQPDADLSRDAATRDVIANTLAGSVQQLLARDPWVRRSRDPEDVHQARVAVRRLRSDLRTFRPLLDSVWQTALRDELRWLGAELGDVRDVEVLRMRLGLRVDDLPPQEALPARRILEDLDERHRVARHDLLEAMASERYAVLLERLVDAAREPRVGPDATTPASHVLPELARGPWKHLQEAVAALGDNPPDEALHEVRIRAKRARYAAEAVAPSVGKPARRYARAVTRIQDVLGEHQDACIAGQWLRSVARDAPTPVVFAAGMMAERERRAADRSRRRFPKAWRRLDAKKLRAWM